MFFGYTEVGLFVRPSVCLSAQNASNFVSQTTLTMYFQLYLNFAYIDHILKFCKM